MAYFVSDWKPNGYSADEYYYKQIYNNFKENTENKTLPFFNKDLNKIPQEISTGKMINNENSIVLEMVASLQGYKSNLWVYGHDLNKIQKQVGELHVNKKAVPALCINKHFGATHLKTQELEISEAGSGNNAQYLYNLDCFDEKSQQKLIKRLGNLNSQENEKYQVDNSRIFIENQSADKTLLNKAKERVIEKSNVEGVNFLPVIDCYYKHSIKNATGNRIGNRIIDNREQNKEHCYKSCNALLETVEKNNIDAVKVGKNLSKALYASIEFQKISLSKGFNMETAKNIEERQIAKNNIKKHPYTSSYGR